jgi:endonuclease/exonuclease/phosphatase family metal-dependent hydrolase
MRIVNLIPNKIRPNWRSLWSIATMALCLGCQTAPPENTRPAAAFRVMTFNIHHGEGLDGKVDLPRIAEVIRREQADLVALQEVDKGVLRTDRRDLPAALAALTGLTCVFSNNFHYQGGEYGNAILTRFPVLSATNSLYQMLRTNEQRGILQLTLKVKGRELVFMNTHIDYRGDDTERLLNVREIQALTAGHAGTPAVLCGDFNDTPASRVHQRLSETFEDAWALTGQGEGWTFPADKPRKRIDYIWTSKGSRIEPVGAHVPDSGASDHRPLVAAFRFK